jgi:hypothetical protein
VASRIITRARGCRSIKKKGARRIPWGGRRKSQKHRTLLLGRARSRFGDWRVYNVGAACDR